MIKYAKVVYMVSGLGALYFLVVIMTIPTLSPYSRSELNEILSRFEIFIALSILSGIFLVWKYLQSRKTGNVSDVFSMTPEMEVSKLTFFQKIKRMFAMERTQKGIFVIMAMFVTMAFYSDTAGFSHGFGIHIFNSQEQLAKTALTSDSIINEKKVQAVPSTQSVDETIRSLISEYLTDWEQKRSLDFKTENNIKEIKLNTFKTLATEIGNNGTYKINVMEDFNYIYNDGKIANYNIYTFFVIDVNQKKVVEHLIDDKHKATRSILQDVISRASLSDEKAIIGHWVSDNTIREIKANLDTKQKQDNTVSITPWHLYISSRNVIIVEGSKIEKFTYAAEYTKDMEGAPKDSNAASLDFNDGTSCAIKLSPGNNRMAMIRNLIKDSTFNTPNFHAVRISFTYVDDKQNP